MVTSPLLGQGSSATALVSLTILHAQAFINPSLNTCRMSEKQVKAYMTFSRHCWMPDALPSLARQSPSSEVDATSGLLHNKRFPESQDMKHNQRQSKKAGCTLTCFKLAFHKLSLCSLPTVKEPALALTPKNHSGGTPGWGWICCSCPKKGHIHRHLSTCNRNITWGLFLKNYCTKTHSFELY